jgi:hypothetical protein
LENDRELPGLILALLEEVVGQKEVLDASDHAFLELVHHGLSHHLGQLIWIPRSSHHAPSEVRLIDQAEARRVTLQNGRLQSIK